MFLKHLLALNTEKLTPLVFNACHTGFLVV